MKTELILASLLMLTSAQHFDQVAMESGPIDNIAMESGNPTADQLQTAQQYVTYTTAPQQQYVYQQQPQQQIMYQTQPQQQIMYQQQPQQQILYQQQPQQYYETQGFTTSGGNSELLYAKSLANTGRDEDSVLQSVFDFMKSQMHTVPMQTYIAPPPAQILTQQNYISESPAPAVINLPVQTQAQYTKYVAPLVQAPLTYSTTTPVVQSANQIVKLTQGYVSEAPVANLVKTYSAPTVINKAIAYTKPLVAATTTLKTVKIPKTQPKIIKSQNTYFQETKANYLPTIVFTTKVRQENKLSQNYGAPAQENKPQNGYGAPAQENKPQGGYGAPAQENRPQGGYQAPAQENRPQGGYQAPAQENRQQGGYQAPAQENRPQGGYGAPAQENRQQGGYQAAAQENKQQGEYQAPAQENRPQGGYGAPAQENGQQGGYQAPAQENRPQGGYGAPTQEIRSQGGYEAPAQEYRNQGGYQASAQENRPQQGYGAPAQENRPQSGYGAPAQESGAQTGYGAPTQENRPQGEYGPPAQENRPQDSYGAPQQENRPQEGYGSPAQEIRAQVVYDSHDQVYRPSSAYRTPQQETKTSGSYDAPTVIQTAPVPAASSAKAGYGPPGYTPPPVLETYIPTFKMTDTHYGAPEPSQPPQNDFLKITQSLISEQPEKSYGPPKEIQQTYGTPQQPREHKHIYVHAAAPETSPTVRLLQPVNRNPEKHYQIIFVKAPSPITSQRTEIQLPPTPEHKTLVYVLTKSPESNHEVKISKPVASKQSPPEVYFIRYAANAPDMSPQYGPPIVPNPALVSRQPTPIISYAAPGNLDVYAPEMKHSSYSTNYRKREISTVIDKENDKSVNDNTESDISSSDTKKDTNDSVI